jgi:hypothetical protein
LVEAFVAVSLRRTLAFCVLAAVLGSYIFLVEKPKIAEEAAPDRLVAFEAADVSSLRLVYPASPTVSLERSGDGWRMTEPVTAPGDKTAVDNLVKQIAEANVDRRIPMSDVESLETYGLDGDGTQARISISLAAGGEVPDIVVGRTTPVGYQAFSRLEGAEEIVVTPLIFHTGVRKTPFELRDKSLFDIPVRSVIAADLRRGDTLIRLERSGDSWKMTEPVDDAADRKEVEGLIAAMNSAAALEFHDDPSSLDDPGFDDPVLTFSVETGAGTSHVLTVGKRVAGPPAGHYVRREGDGLAATVAESTRVLLDKDANALRDKQLFNCTADQIERMKFERADGTGFELALAEDGHWTVTPGTPDATVREGIIKRTRGGLASLEAAEVVSEMADTPETLRPFALDEPQISVTVEGVGGRSCGRVLAAVVDENAENSKHYVVRDGSSVVMSMPSYHYSRLDARREDFLEIPKNE